MKILTTIIIVVLMFPGKDTAAQHQHHNMKSRDMKEMDMGEKKVQGPAKKTAVKSVKTDADIGRNIHSGPVADTTKTKKGSDAKRTEEMDMDAMDMSDTALEMNQDMDMNQKAGMHNMSHSLSRNLPMSRDGSGTSWNPDMSPMYMTMLHSKKWMYMFHGNFFIRYNKQDVARMGSRGDEQWDAPNMLMAMGQRKIGMNGLLHFNTMFSLDALFTGQRGYPLLFQSGESAHGEPLVDRQHPHDLFAELSMGYSLSLSKNSDAYVYAAYPGEPALGATTFMHRASGMDNPDAPISHHWVDATHITFGVVTLGYRLGKLKIEASSFTGREPNEARFDFDRPRFDSRSARLWFNPDKHWAMQVSHGFIKSPEELHSDDDVFRTTASVSYSKKAGPEKFFSVTGLWGMNRQKGHDGEHAALMEASWRANLLVIYGRYEWVQKSVEELKLDTAYFGNDARFPVNAFTLGAGYDLLRKGIVRTSLGTQFSVYHSDQKLDQLYGRNPMAWEIYLRFYPSLMKQAMDEKMD